MLQIELVSRSSIVTLRICEETLAIAALYGKLDESIVDESSRGIYYLLASHKLQEHVRRQSGGDYRVFSSPDSVVPY